SLVNGPGGRDYAKAYGVTEIPANFLVGRDGTVVHLDLARKNLTPVVGRAIARRGGSIHVRGIGGWPVCGTDCQAESHSPTGRRSVPRRETCSRPVGGVGRPAPKTGVPRGETPPEGRPSRPSYGGATPQGPIGAWVTWGRRRGLPEARKLRRRRRLPPH